MPCVCVPTGNMFLALLQFGTGGMDLCCTNRSGPIPLRKRLFLDRDDELLFLILHNIWLVLVLEMKHFCHDHLGFVFKEESQTIFR